MADEPKRIATIDDFFKDLREKHAKDINEALKHIDEYQEEDNQLHQFNNIFAPAQDELYNALVANLASKFKDTDKLHKKEDDIKEAVVAGLTKYFEKAMPSILDLIEDADDVDTKYQILTHHYDEMVAGPGKSVLQGIHGLAEDKKITVGHLKKMFYQQKSSHANSAVNQLQDLHQSHYLSRFHQTELAAHLKPEIEAAGYDITDKVKYARQHHGDLMNIRAGLKDGTSWGVGKDGKPLGPDTYGIEKKGGEE